MASETTERIEWELKFQEKVKENKFVTPSSHLNVEEIKSFIRETLANREKEIAEEVDKKKEKLPYTPRYCQSRNGIYYCGTCEQAWETCSCSARNTGYNRALDKVLQIIKH